MVEIVKLIVNDHHQENKFHFIKKFIFHTGHCRLSFRNNLDFQLIIIVFIICGMFFNNLSFVVGDITIRTFSFIGILYL